MLSFVTGTANFGWQEPTREEKIDYFKKMIRLALSGRFEGVDAFVLGNALNYVTRETYSKEELGLDDEKIKQLNAYLKAWDKREQGGEKIRALDRALDRESRKFYFFKGKKKQILKEMALEIKAEMKARNLTYLDCRIDENSVEKFIAS